MKRLVLKGIVLVVLTVLASAAVAEEDHLLGYKVKSLEKLKPNTIHVVTNRFGADDCELKGKAILLLAQSEKDGGDDPRGGAAGQFACYKAKCTGSLPPPTRVDHQLGEETYESKKVQLLCVPVDQHVCGDDDVDPGEACDGSDDGACPGGCLTDCTCPPPVCGNGVREGTEECDPPDDSACVNDCLAGCTCAVPCPGTDGDAMACKGYGGDAKCAGCCNNDKTCSSLCYGAVKLSCSDARSNELCAYAVSSAGCAAECCR